MGSVVSNLFSHNTKMRFAFSLSWTLKHDKFIHTASDSTLRLIFKKLPLFWFDVLSKKKIHNYLKTTTSFFQFPTTQLCKARFSSYTTAKTTYLKGLNAQEDTRIQHLLLSQALKNMCEIVDQCYTSNFFFCFGT